MPGVHEEDLHGASLHDSDLLLRVLEMPSGNDQSSLYESQCMLNLQREALSSVRLQREEVL